MKRPDISIVIIGAGRMAAFLLHTFRGKQIPVFGIWGRNLQHANALAEAYAVQCLEQLSDIPLSSTFCFLAISDDAIPSVSKAIPPIDGILVHTAGAVPLEAIDSRHRRAVMYPLQTLGGTTFPDPVKVPILLEAESQSDLALLSELATAIGDSVIVMSSARRLQLHLAAVMVNNFTNHIIELAEEFCASAQLPFSLLHPLIMQTASLAGSHPGQLRQTGPGKRGDQHTIQKHLELLDHHPELRSLYETLTQSIRQRYPSEP
jgi:predicted short-subunit dehydrogenase-like oxidoreductase (DUF2520 family)